MVVKMVVRRVERDVPIAACKAAARRSVLDAKAALRKYRSDHGSPGQGVWQRDWLVSPVGVGSGWSVRPFSLDHQGTSQLLYRATANPSGFASRLCSMTKMRSTPARVPRCADAYDLMIVTEAYEASGLGGPGTSTELLREVKSRHLLH
jgi:hypothetical protein